MVAPSLLGKVRFWASGADVPEEPTKEPMPWRWMGVRRIY
jgi:hypothetical protein